MREETSPSCCFWGDGGDLRDEAPCGVLELELTQASVSKRQLNVHKCMEFSYVLSKTGPPFYCAQYR